MFKTAILIAVFIPSSVFAGIKMSPPTTQSQQPEQGKSMIVTGAHRAGAFGYLSMGPDPGGKTGDTVTPTPTSTSQPSSDGTRASSQSGGSSTATPGAAGTKTDQSAPPTKQ